MAKTQAWLSAFRLRTLPLALSSILVGSALASFHGSHNSAVLFLALLTATLLQVLSNLANDLGDHEHGTDNEDRVGPARAVQSGEISPAAMKRAMFVCAVLAFFSGTALIVVALGFSVKTLLFLILGLAAIAAAIKYTYGKNPYGYAGLGDISVFLFFGLAGVVGSYFLHTHSVHNDSWLLAIVFGLLSMGVLNLNNMRDIENDSQMGKRTLAVKLGASGSKLYHLLLILVPVVITCLFLRPFFADTPASYAALIPVLLLVLILIASLKRSGVELDPFLKRLALSTFMLAIAFAILFYTR